MGELLHSHWQDTEQHTTRSVGLVSLIKWFAVVYVPTACIKFDSIYIYLQMLMYTSGYIDLNWFYVDLW